MTNPNEPQYGGSHEPHGAPGAPAPHGSQESYGQAGYGQQQYGGHQENGYRADQSVGVEGAPAQQYQQPGGYGHSAYDPQMAYGHTDSQAVAKDNGKALPALIVGVVGLLLSWLFFPIGMILDVVAIVLGFLARRGIAQSGGLQKGSGKALAALILGAIGLIIGLSVLGYTVSHWDELQNRVSNQN